MGGVKRALACATALHYAKILRISKVITRKARLIREVFASAWYNTILSQKVAECECVLPPKNSQDR